MTNGLAYCKKGFVAMVGGKKSFLSFFSVETNAKPV